MVTSGPGTGARRRAAPDPEAGLLDAIDHLRPYDARRLLIVLRDGSEIVASRTASERLRHVVR